MLVCSNGKTVAKVHVLANSSVSDLRNAIAASLNGDAVNFASADFEDEALLCDLGLRDASFVELLPPPTSPEPPLILDHTESPEAMAPDKSSKPPGGLVKIRRERRDRKGTPIQRGQTRHKVTYADHIVGRDALAEVKEVPYIYDSSGRGCRCSIM